MSGEDTQEVLVDVVLALKADQLRLREALAATLKWLRKHGEHARSCCDTSDEGGPACTCGLDELLAQEEPSSTLKYVPPTLADVKAAVAHRTATQQKINSLVRQLFQNGTRVSWGTAPHRRTGLVVDRYGDKLAVELPEVTGRCWVHVEIVDCIGEEGPAL